ncbi:MAG: hypothetical protein EAX95_13610 [Candidatus Thorarchaeota archaeon]|nr:hypothetical protein [Candidatus Thorarchaeota archaeon]
MIFVTVGTSLFDQLIEEIDRLVGQGIIKERVIAQVGRGFYKPKNIQYFRFMRNLAKAYDAADVIVSSGGAGTTMECVHRGLRLVVVENEGVMEGHQAQLIGEMAKRGHLVWCTEITDLASSIEEAKHRTFEKFVSDPPRVHQLILDLLQKPANIS